MTTQFLPDVSRATSAFWTLNSCLKTIQADKYEDCKIVAKALTTIIEGTSSNNLPSNLKYKIKLIKNIIKNSEEEREKNELLEAVKSVAQKYLTSFSKFKANYVELANEYLDKILVEKPEDFEEVVDALKTINETEERLATPAAENDAFSQKLKEYIDSIKELLEAPDIYVEEINIPLFRKIIMKRVAAKIQEFETFTKAEQERYLQNQQDLRAITQENQAKIAAAQPPREGSLAHTLSEEEWLREQQNQFQGQVENRRFTVRGFTGRLPFIQHAPSEVERENRDRDRARLLSSFIQNAPHNENIFVPLEEIHLNRLRQEEQQRDVAARQLAQELLRLVTESIDFSDITGPFHQVRIRPVYEDMQAAFNIRNLDLPNFFIPDEQDERLAVEELARELPLEQQVEIEVMQEVEQQVEIEAEVESIAQDSELNQNIFSFSRMTTGIINLFQSIFPFNFPFNTH